MKDFFASLVSTLLVVLLPVHSCTQDDPSKPNVIIVITDDQGYGDLGCHGNQIIKTPNLDQFYNEAIRFTDFHVSPTCSPTRAALMTGRYTNRTGCWHTIAGRSQIFEEEMTMAEVFAANGYSTGMFGKWHLGDNYPFRPEDKGFQVVLRHGGGGIGQGPDFWGNDYFDDTYWLNGSTEPFSGYCTDVFFDRAIEFIESNKEQPFFCYISTNAPHGPLHVPEEYYNLYREETAILDHQKRFYGMITNIDDNFKKLDDRLKDLGLDQNTIVIFLTDNGTAGGIATSGGVSFGFDGGMKGAKNSEYEGGHRVPLFIRWPEGKLTGGNDIPVLTAHIDILPTLVELCNLDFQPVNNLDGTSLVPLLRNSTNSFPDRTLIVDSQRLQNLVKWRKSAVMHNSWRLVNGVELFNLEDDPKQTTDISDEFPEIVERLRSEYEDWWQSLQDDGVNEKYAYIKAGTEFEDPVRISSHDMHCGDHNFTWHQHGALLARSATGIFKIDITSAGKYNFKLCRYPLESGYGFNENIPAREENLEISQPMPASTNVNFVKGRLIIADINIEKNIQGDEKGISFEVFLHKGKYDMESILIDETGKKYTAYYVYVDKME